MTDERLRAETDHDLGAAFVRRNVSIDTGHISYLVRSRPGPTLILIPGSFSDSLAFMDVINGMDDQLQIIVQEVRGHGGSWPPPRRGSIEQFAEDVLRVVDDLKLESFYVGGHSIGGMIALEVGRLRPAKLKGIISIEGWTSHHVVPNAFRGLTGNTMTTEHKEKNARLRSHVLDSWSQEEVDEFRLYWRRWDGFDFLSATDLPILEIYGDRGREKPVREKLRIPDRPNITLHWIEDVSHNMHLEAPDEIARVTDDFIAHCESSGDTGSP